MAIITGISHCIGGEGDFDIKELFPRYPFKDADDETSEVSVESSKAAVRAAFGGLQS